MEDLITNQTDSLAKLATTETDSIHSLLPTASVDAISTPQFEGFDGLIRQVDLMQQDWLFITLISIFSLFVFFLIASYRDLFGRIKSVFSKDISEKTDATSGQSGTIYKFFYLAFSLTVFSLAGYIVIHQKLNITDIHNIFYIFAILASFFFIKYLLFKFVGFVFLSKPKADAYIKLYFTLIYILSFLVFINIIIYAYQPLVELNSFIYINFALTIISFIVLTIKLLQFFMVKPIALFYIFLYLCTLEFLPTIVLYYLVEKFMLLV